MHHQHVIIRTHVHHGGRQKENRTLVQNNGRNTEQISTHERQTTTDNTATTVHFLTGQFFWSSAASPKVSFLELF